MRWMTDFSLVMRSTVTSFWERVQDPERVLHQLLIDMDEEAERVRHSVAGAIADEIRLGRDAKAARAESEAWLARAKSALARGDEASAEAALARRVAAGDRADALGKEYAKQKEQTPRLQQAVRDLEDKIRQARQKQTLLLARLAGAESSQRVNRALARVGTAAADRSAFAQFERLEAKVDRAEAMGEAYARLDGREPAEDELIRKFEQAERKERLGHELAELKRKVGGEGEAGT